MLVHIECWFCHLCLCYKNKYSTRSFVSQFWLKLRERWKTSAMTEGVVTVCFWCFAQISSLLFKNITQFFLGIFVLLKYLESLFFSPYLHYSLSAHQWTRQTVLTNRLQFGGEKKKMFLSDISAPLRSEHCMAFSPCGETHSTPENLTARKDWTRVNFPINGYAVFRFLSNMGFPFHKITRILTWTMTVTSTERCSGSLCFYSKTYFPFQNICI